MKFTANYSQHNERKEIEQASSLLRDANHIIVGIGAGMSASGGLDYTDSELVRRWYPTYFEKGYRSIFQILSSYWEIGQSPIDAYWGYWAQHIDHIRYEAPPSEPYRLLSRILDGSDYFVVSTNADGQLGKSGIPAERIFAPQGDYSFFQCEEPCSETVYDNRQMIRSMLDGLYTGPDGIPRIRKEDIPRCPNCHRLLKPNLRADETFVEDPHMANYPAYREYVRKCIDSAGQTVLLELGIGFNTPSIIRYPFEQLAGSYPNIHLVRINKNDASLPKGIGPDSLCIPGDLKTVLGALHDRLPCNGTEDIVGA